MEIVEVRADNVYISLKQPFTYTGVTLHHLPYVLITIKTKSGILGYGEASAAWDITGETQESVRGALRHAEKLLTGQAVDDIADVWGIMHSIAHAIAFNGAMKCAVETALLDIVGKARGRPVSDLFNRTRKNKVTVSALLPITRDLATVEDTIHRILQNGFTQVKIKAGIDFMHDKKVLKRIRKISSDIGITLDINQGWRQIDRAIDYCNALGEFDLLWIEQPIAADDFEGLKKIREHCPVKIMADESMHTLKDCRILCEMQAVDLVNIKLAKCGGLLSALAIADFCDAHEQAYVVGSMIESTLGMAANVHFASLVNYTITDFGSLSFLDQDYATGLHLRGNGIDVPDKAGLGIAMNSPNASNDKNSYRFFS
ncbi:MAG: dipeptide epimerase [Chitinispirillaceae bacterium]|nr:dipeptide epimerase [Chitinispirillaceae bacterium]